MPVRTVTLLKAKLSPTGLALLEWGDWTGKPKALGENIVVPIACDDDYEHKIFRVFVYPEARIHNHETWGIRKCDLTSLENSDVNDWWNATAENLLDRVEQAALSLAATDALAEIPTPNCLGRAGRDRK